jgi:hypothetical protein
MYERQFMSSSAIGLQGRDGHKGHEVRQAVTSMTSIFCPPLAAARSTSRIASRWS